MTNVQYYLCCITLRNIKQINPDLNFESSFEDDLLMIFTYRYSNFSFDGKRKATVTQESAR